MDTKFKLFLTIIGILLIGNVLASTLTQNVTVTVIGPTNFTLTQNVTVTVIAGTIIENETYIPFCSLERGNITFYADVSGPCTQEVIFSINTNGTWENFTGHETIEGLGLGNYSYELYSCLFNRENLQWKVYAKDCYGYTYNGSLDEFYIYSRTALTIIPSNPQGENLWYTTPPRFTLENLDATEIFYKWGNSGAVHQYTGEFGMENSPTFNGGGGTVDLIYWGVLPCGDESARRQLIKLDLYSPSITNIIPANNSLVQESKPDIYAKIIESTGKGSGIDSSSIVVKLDEEVQTNCTINKGVNPLDLVVKCSPNSNLPDGKHKVSVYAEDNAGRSSEFLWNFDIKKVDYSFDLQVYSPDKEIYSKTKVPFNLSVGRKINSIEYIDWNSLNPRWTKLCSNCQNYGFLNSKSRVFTEGLHNITIRGTNGFVVEKKNLSFMIDAKAPRIYSTTPKSNQLANGSFYVKFEEKNVNKVSLIINKIHIYDVTDCVYDGKYNECTIEVDLSTFEGQKIGYYFNVSDYFRSTSSNTVKTRVNTSS